MPCFSAIRTQLKDGARVLAAIKALGLVARTDGADMATIHADNAQGETLVSLVRQGDAYTTISTGDTLKAISRKYAEIGVRQWAQQRGYMIQSNDGRKLALIRR